MAGTLTLSTLSDGTNSTSSTNPIKGSAKSWVNFGYVSSAITVRDSFNVSSVTRSGVGLYAVNLTNAVPNTNYAPQVTACRYLASTSYAGSGFARPTSTTQVFVFTGYEDTYSGAIAVDVELCYVAVLSS